MITSLEPLETIFSEGKKAYFTLLCHYSLSINPYKDSRIKWASHYWRKGFQYAYFEQNPPTTKSSELSYHMRNEGYGKCCYPHYTTGRD
jgi:hypothetical protein